MLARQQDESRSIFWEKTRGSRPKVGTSPSVQLGWGGMHPTYESLTLYLRDILVATLPIPPPKT